MLMLMCGLLLLLLLLLLPTLCSHVCCVCCVCVYVCAHHPCTCIRFSVESAHTRGHSSSNRDRCERDMERERDCTRSCDHACRVCHPSCGHVCVHVVVVSFMLVSADSGATFHIASSCRHDDERVMRCNTSCEAMSCGVMRYARDADAFSGRSTLKQIKSYGSDYT